MLNETIAVNEWLKLENLYPVNKFWGCGYEGTGNSITNHTFSNGTNCGLTEFSALTSATTLSVTSLILAGLSTYLF